jgi:Trypsin
MILRLLTPAKHHTPVRLNDDPSLPHTHSNLTVLGWGRTDLHISYDPPPLLQQTHMTYLDPNVCEQRNSKYTPDMMCAEGINPTRGPCRGDSGGPLLMNSNHQSKVKLVGIVSFSQIECVHRKLWHSVEFCSK